MRSSKKKTKTKRFRANDIKKLLKHNSPFAIREAYNAARTNLMFTNTGDGSPVYIVTSAVPNDGKSITCLNLAISFAMMGKKTLVMDFDMRNPSLHRFFKLQQEHGVSELLAGLDQQISFKETIYENLWMVSSGKTPPNPAELLSGERAAKILQFAKEKFDYIFIDTPPVEIVTDVMVVAKQVTGVIVVVRSGITDGSILKHSIMSLEQGGARIVGFILNDLSPKNYTYGKKNMYKYYKTYKYSSDGNNV